MTNWYVTDPTNDLITYTPPGPIIETTYYRAMVSVEGCPGTLLPSLPATITVEDNVDPTAICQDITVELDASGAVSITAEDIDNGSYDNCGIDDLSLDITSFDCSDVGPNTVTLTVTDVAGNSSTCTATVTVEDNIDPTAICHDITVQLDASGNATITAAQIDNGSQDNCGIASLVVSQNTFTCSELGENSVQVNVF